ncbi:YggT family protein [Allofustis seminis]|uniref:YggT family protein n=1 Tax=Allofustis seminis TaxID=166939 RepID=UPI00037D6C87|nr:YggT family protein [Allofustis seminis]
MVQLLLGLRVLVSRFLEIYRLALLAYFLLSWLPEASDSGLGRLLERICEPYVSYFRRFIPPVGMISFAGMAAYICLAILERGFNTIIIFLIRLIG